MLPISTVMDPDRGKHVCARGAYQRMERTLVKFLHTFIKIIVTVVREFHLTSPNCDPNTPNRGFGSHRLPEKYTRIRIKVFSLNSNSYIWIKNNYFLTQFNSKLFKLLIFSHYIQISMTNVDLHQLKPTVKNGAGVLALRSIKS
jgi:hypothetical protein